MFNLLVFIFVMTYNINCLKQKHNGTPSKINFILLCTHSNTTAVAQTFCMWVGLSLQENKNMVYYVY